MYLIYMFAFESASIFLPHGLDPPTSSKSGNCDLSKCTLNIFIFEIIWKLENTFLCP